MRCPTFSIAFSIPEKKSYFIFRSELFELLYLDLDSERHEGRGTLSVNFQRRVLKPILAYSTYTQCSGTKFAYIHLDLVFFSGTHHLNVVTATLPSIGKQNN